MLLAGNKKLFIYRPIIDIISWDVFVLFICFRLFIKKNKYINMVECEIRIYTFWNSRNTTMSCNYPNFQKIASLANYISFRLVVSWSPLDHLNRQKSHLKFDKSLEIQNFDHFQKMERTLRVERKTYFWNFSRV